MRKCPISRNKKPDLMRKTLDFFSYLGGSISVVKGKRPFSNFIRMILHNIFAILSSTLKSIFPTIGHGMLALSDVAANTCEGGAGVLVCVRCTLVTTVRVAPVVKQLFLYCMCMCNLALFSTLNFCKKTPFSGKTDSPDPHTPLHCAGCCYSRP